MPDRSALYRVDRRTVLTPGELNKRFLDINARILGIETPRLSEDEAFGVVLDRVLSRSESVIGGMRDQLLSITQLEWLTATSSTSITLAEEAEVALIIPEAQRGLFAPGPFALLTRAAAAEDYAVVRTLAFDRVSGQWDIRIEAFYGDEGPFDDWLITAIAGSTLAQYSLLAEGREARDLAVEARGVIVPLAAQIDGDAAAIEAARVEIDGDAAAAETARSQAVAAKDLAVAAGAAGRQTIPIPAGIMRRRLTNGATAVIEELATNKHALSYWAFDGSVSQAVHFLVPMPKAYNGGPVTFRPRWKHPDTTTNFGVVFALRAVAVGDNEALDAAFGAAQISTDTGGTTGRQNIGPESPAITIAGAPAGGKTVLFELYRATADAGDTMAAPAHLLGGDLFITTNAGTDA